MFFMIAVSALLVSSIFKNQLFHTLV